MMRAHEKPAATATTSSCFVFQLDFCASLGASVSAARRARATLFHSMPVFVLRECTFTSLHLVDRFRFLAWQWHIAVFIIRRFAYECIAICDAISFIPLPTTGSRGHAQLPNLTLNYLFIISCNMKTKKNKKTMKMKERAHHAKCPHSAPALLLFYSALNGYGTYNHIK